MTKAHPDPGPLDPKRTYYDYYAGEALDYDLLSKGRAAEINQMDEFHVVRRKLQTHELDPKGQRVRSKWIDYLKAPGLVRSRLVAQEVAYAGRDDCAAGTPPLKAVRMIFCLATSKPNRRVKTKKLRRQVAKSPQAVPATVVAKRLIEKGYLTRPLAVTRVL